MKRAQPKIIFFFAFALLYSSALVAAAQEEQTCNLRIDVYEYKSDGTSEQFPVRDAKLEAVDAETNKTLKFESENVLANAGGRSFKLTITGKGFQNETRQVFADCESADAQGTTSEIIFLWPQNVKKPVSSIAVGQRLAPVSTRVKETSPASDDKIINGRAVRLVRPAYPAAARPVRASGAVNVQVTINELGYVVSARALGGHPLLQRAAVQAARASKFTMTYLEGFPVKVTGVIVYNFVP